MAVGIFCALRNEEHNVALYLIIYLRFNLGFFVIAAVAIFNCRCPVDV